MLREPACRSAPCANFLKLKRITDRDVRQWVAFAGLDPREYRSGSSVDNAPRIGKGATRIYAMRCTCPPWSPANTSRTCGVSTSISWREAKNKRLALTAVARKLLHAIFGMFRSFTPYDGIRVFPLPAPKTA